MVHIEAIPTLKTNYVWLLRPSLTSRWAYVVDPGESGPVLERLERHSLSLAGILVTHHHWDHTDGLDGLLERLPVPVYGPPSVRQVTHPQADGSRLTLDTVELRVLAVPGHTLDHIAYVHGGSDNNRQPPFTLCGDALFAAGCGRLLGGSAAQALASLKSLADLPEKTLIYCGHEYTLANLRFARRVEPDNLQLAHRQRREERRIARLGRTLPSILKDELRTNPFLRCNEPGLRACVESHWGRMLGTEVDVFAALRQWKDAQQTIR